MDVGFDSLGISGGFALKRLAIVCPAEGVGLFVDSCAIEFKFFRCGGCHRYSGRGDGM